jgi:hypothetical protein
MMTELVRGLRRLRRPARGYGEGARNASILLVDPKYEHNLGAVVRAAAVLGASAVRWTGTRITFPMRRLPREERLAHYKERVDFSPFPPAVSPKEAIEGMNVEGALTPIAIELRENGSLPETSSIPTVRFTSLALRTGRWGEARWRPATASSASQA